MASIANFAGATLTLAVIVETWCVPAAADAGAAKLTGAGVLDSSFGASGTRIDGPASSGHKSVIASGTQLYILGFANDGFYLGRWNSNGAADTSFGYLGVTTAPLGAGTANPLSVKLWNDKPLVLINVFGTSFTTAFIVRFTSTGAVDTTFGNQGIVKPFGDGAADGMDVRADGAMYVYSNLGPHGMYMVKVSKNGGVGVSSEVKFCEVAQGGNGGTSGEFITSLAFDSMSRPVVVGMNELNGVGVRRFNTDLTPDSTFVGNGGSACPNSFRSTARFPSGLYVSPDDKIVYSYTSSATTLNFGRLTNIGTSDSWSGSLNIPSSNLVDWVDKIRPIGNDYVFMGTADSERVVSFKVSSSTAMISTPWGASSGISSFTFPSFEHSLASDFTIDSNGRLVSVGSALH